MKVEFRTAGTNDIADILRLMEAFCTIDGYPFDEVLRRANVSRFISDPLLGKLWMIDYEGEVAGYVVLAFSFSFEFKGRDAFIDELYLSEHVRGKGVGGKAIDFVIQRARELGVKAVHLEVEKHNENGNQLYRKKDFRDHNRFLMTRFLSNE